MNVTAFPNPISKKIVHIKSDYSHITSRLFSSLSKSKEKQKTQPPKEEILYQTLKLSLEKVSLIGQQKYKDAMRHVEKFKKLDEDIKRRKAQEKIDSECTFKPKVTNNKKYNPEARFMNLSFTERNYIKGKDVSPKKIVDQNQQPKQKKRILGQKLAERLMNWGKERDTKIANKRVEAQLSRSISRNSSIGSNQDRKSQKKSTLSKERSYRKLYEKKLEVKMPYEFLDSEKSPRVNEFTNGYDERTTPKKSGRTNHELSKSMISMQSANSIKTGKRKELLNGLLEDIKNQKIDENQISFEQNDFIKKRTKFYTEISSSLHATTRTLGKVGKSNTVGQKILMSQAQRGQGSFYLRQAKANIHKTDKKVDVLVKNDQYSKKFSNSANLSNSAKFSRKYVNAVVLKSKQAREMKEPDLDSSQEKRGKKRYSRVMK